MAQRQLDQPVDDGAVLLSVQVRQAARAVHRHLHGSPQRELPRQAHGIRQISPGHQLCTTHRL